MAADAKTLISMSLRDQASRQLKQFERNWKSTMGAIEQDGAGGLEDAIGGMLNSGLGKLGAGIAGFFAVGKLTQTVTELGQLGAQAQRTQAAFGELAGGVGQSADAMLAAMRTATAGTVADSELMLSANRAMMLGVADNAEEMAGIMAAAITRGRALGVSASQAVGDVITGIGRMSPQILDNLGIVGVASAFDDYAASLGKTAEQLTEVEKKQALVNAVIASSGGGAAVIDDAAAAFERMDASIQNAKEAMGILFGPAVAAIADRLAEAATITSQALTENPLVQAEATIAGRVQRLLKEAQDAAMVSVAPGAPVGPEGLGGSGLSDQAQRLQLVLFAIQQVDQAQQAGVSSASIWADQITRIAERVVAFGDVSDDSLRSVAILLGNIATTTAAEQLQRTAGTMGALSDATRPTAEQIAATNAALQGIATTGGASAETIAQVTAAAQSGLQGIAREVAAIQGDQAGLDWLATMNRLLDDQISKWAAEGRTVAQITGVLLPNYIANLRKVADGANKSATATASIAKGAQTAGTVGARMMAGLAIKIGQVTRAAQIATGAISRMGGAADAVSTGRGGGLGEGFRTADYEPILKATDATSALDFALSGLLDTAYTGGGGGGGIGGIADEFSDLQSTIQGVIGEAMSADIGGLDPAAFLPREDAINENARRLAAIMRDGIAGQEWLDEFKAEVPALWEELSSSGDPKGAAARMLQEFQQGLRPELLDRDMIKARVKAMLLGEENSSALAAEIAAELSGELGMSLAQAQQAVAGVMGVGAGGMAGTGAQVGPDGAAQGSQFVAAWAGMVKTQLTEFENTGKQAGASWGAGFMATVEGGVPGQLVALLVSLVTPGVLANIAAQGSRTGAQ